MFKQLFLFLLLLFTNSCSTQKQAIKVFNSKYLTKLVTWNESIRRLILLQSDSTIDSVSKVVYNKGNGYVLKYFNNNQLTTEKTFGLNGNQISETKYSTDTLFKLKEEMCGDNPIKSECIFYQNNMCGLSTKWRCDGIMEEEGFIFKNEKFGVWQYSDNKRKRIIVNYGKYYLADSFDLIKVVIH